MKTFKILLEDIGLSTGTGLAMPEKPMAAAKRSQFANIEVFEVSQKTFQQCKMGKEKFKHWKTFVGEDQIGNEIKEYANARNNRHKAIILKCEATGSMLFVKGNYSNIGKG